MENTIEFKGTQGKWIATTEINWPFRTSIETPDGNELVADIGMAHVSTSDQTVEDCLKRDYEANSKVLANAKLIASAPLLLENLLRLIDRMEENDLGHMSAVRRAKEAVEQALWTE